MASFSVSVLIHSAIAYFVGKSLVAVDRELVRTIMQSLFEMVGVVTPYSYSTGLVYSAIRGNEKNEEEQSYFY
jgi:hypothetical protein